MNFTKINITLRKLHLWLAIAIGVQLGLWLMSGLFMTLFSIDTVRGDHLRKATDKTALILPATIAPPSAILSRRPNAQTISLHMVQDRPVYILTEDGARHAFDALTGAAQAALSESDIRDIAQTHYTGDGTILSATFYEGNAPREYRRDGPIWQVQFGKADKAHFYLDALTGEVKAVRTDLWRVFDFMWGLHIMDWRNRENFNSWWIKSVAAIALLFFLTGLALIFIRMKRHFTTPS